MTINNDYIILGLSDGVLFCWHKPVIINLRIAKEIVQQRHDMSKGESYPCVVDIRDLGGVEMDAVNYFSSEKSSRNITAMALIIKSSIVANLANFYYKLFGSKIPTRLFSCELQAKEWIKQYNNG